MKNVKKVAIVTDYSGKQQKFVTGEMLDIGGVLEGHDKPLMITDISVDWKNNVIVTLKDESQCTFGNMSLEYYEILSAGE